jgi:glutamate-1-semialdehyde 2,1-aminomutase
MSSLWPGNPRLKQMEVAERIAATVLCAEMMRLGKNGSDATSGAIRLPRAFTGRDRVAVCGDHRWQEWYNGSTARHGGVLIQAFVYNDLPSLERVLDGHLVEFAAAILEPMNVSEPAAGFLQGVKDLARRRTLLVFDETSTKQDLRYEPLQPLFKVR